MAFNFPIDAYLQAQQAKNQNQQNMYGNIAGLGQGLGEGFNTIGMAMQEEKKKKILEQLVKAMQSQGQVQQGPQMPMAGDPIPGPQGYVPPGAGPNAVPAGQSPMNQFNPSQPIQDNSAQIQGLATQLDPMMGMKMYMQGQKSKLGGGAKPTGTIYRNSDTGEMTDDPNVAVGPEWKAYKTSQGDVLNKLAGQTSGKAKNEAYASRAEAMQRGIDTKQIDLLIQRTGLTSKQQSVLQMNNLRSARALTILNQPKITWQELALGEIDLTGIMQGGVPVRDEIVATHFPGWQEQVARWKTYATGHPTENVPPDIQKKVKDLVGGVIKVDNRIMYSNAKFAKEMLGPTIRGGLQPSQSKSIDTMTQSLTDVGQGESKSQADPLGIR